MSKPSFFAKLTAKPGKRDEVVAAFDKMLSAVADEAGTLVYSVHLDNADENALWIFELYTDDEAMAAHSSSAAMATLFGDISQLLGDGPLLVPTTSNGGKGLPS
jgi:quinol monooxygenase YgiN